MLKFITLVLLMLLGVGCVEGPCEKKYGTCPASLPADQEDDWRGSNLDSTLTLDPSLSDAELEATANAVEAWGKATNGKVRIKLVMGEADNLPTHAVVRRAHAGELKDGELASTGTTILSLGEGLGDNPYIQSVLMHEFGHYLGLGHEPELFDDIMYPYTHDGMAVDATPDALGDLKELYEW
jgi:hypothetical protein